MSQLTANSMLPIVSTLPTAEKHELLRMLTKMVKPAPKNRKRDIYSKIGEDYRPENIEILVTKITTNL